MHTIIFPQQNDISLEVTASPIQKPWAIVAPHENEHVINQYAAQKVEAHGGILVVLRQNGERHKELNINGNIYEIDPNRIFTDLGRRSTLSRLNADLVTNSEEYKKALMIKMKKH